MCSARWGPWPCRAAVRWRAPMGNLVRQVVWRGMRSAGGGCTAGGTWHVLVVVVRNACVLTSLWRVPAWRILAKRFVNGVYQFTKLRFVWSLPTGHHCPLSCRYAVRLNVVPALAIWLAYPHLKSPIRIAQGITGRPLLSCFPTSPLHIRDTHRPSFLRSCVSVNLECMIQFSRIVVWPPRPTTSCMRAPTATLPYKR